MSPETDRRPTPRPTARFTTLVACAAAMAAGALPGCSSLHLSQSGLPGFTKESEVTPTQMVDVWTDTVLRQPGKPGIRGFGGRVLFLDGEGEDKKPIQVDGTLTVFVFDAENPNPESLDAEKTFIFQQELLPQHYSMSKLGHSYSFWLPWDEVGGPLRQVSLIARFDDHTGAVLMSKETKKTLPGTRINAPAQRGQTPETADDPRAGAVRQVTHDAPVARPPEEITENGSARNQMNTITITVPPSFASQILARQAGQPGARVSTNREPIGPRNAFPLQTGPPEDFRESRGNQALQDESASLNFPEKRSAGLADPPAGSWGGVAQPARFPHERFPARRGPVAGQGSAPVRTGPHRATWQSGLPRTPRYGWSGSTTTTTPSGPTVRN